MDFFRQRSLAGALLLSMVLTVVTFAIPDPVLAVACEDGPCNYEGKVGHCGPWDDECGCFPNSGPGGEWEPACIDEET